MDGRFIGLMSGTSLDGVDGVLCSFGPGDGALHVHAHVHRPMPPALALEFLTLQAPGPDELHRAALAANGLVRLYAQVVHTLMQHSGTPADHVTAIGAHGQTVRHRPGAFDTTGYTLQLNAPALLAELTGLPVVADFRSRDVAAGGQGAPLVPAFHQAMFARPDRTVCVLNLGGIGNLTVLEPGGTTLGFDTGPANGLMDDWCHKHMGRPYDDRGSWAASGVVSRPLLERLLGEPYFARVAPKSTGRDLFNASWLDAKLNCDLATTRLPARDVQATLAELTASSCADALLATAPQACELLVCGGGARNVHVMARLGALLPDVKVDTTVARGLQPEQVEACAFAWLARAWFRNECGNLPQATGAVGPRRLGALYPAA